MKQLFDHDVRILNMMRLRFGRQLILCFLLVWFCSGQTQAAPALRIYRIEDRQYVAARELADWLGLKFTGWNDKTATYRSQSTVLRLTVDSREAEINGVSQWLMAPVALRDSWLFIPKTDVYNTILPILQPVKSSAIPAIKTIVIDAGHGGTDEGARNHQKQVTEKFYTLDMAKRLGPMLSNAGYRVVMLRQSDVFLETAQRDDIANRYNADLFISLHFNAAPTKRSDAQGIETYCLALEGESTNHQGRSRARDSKGYPGNRFDDENILLAHLIQRELIRNTKATDRGVKRERWVQLKDIKCPAVLVEGGFLSNKTEVQQIMQPSYRNKMAQAIVNAVLAYQQLLERGNTAIATSQARGVRASRTASASPAKKTSTPDKTGSQKTAAKTAGGTKAKPASAPAKVAATGQATNLPVASVTSTNIPAAPEPSVPRGGTNAPVRPSIVLSNAVPSKAAISGSSATAPKSMSATNKSAPATTSKPLAAPEKKVAAPAVAPPEPQVKAPLTNSSVGINGAVSIPVPRN